MSNKASILKKKGTALATEERAIPKPSTEEVLVKSAAIATNPVDWKMRDAGGFIESYPTILGSDVAGTVEQIGSNVTHFMKGDRVTGFAGVLHTKNVDQGAFQEYCLVEQNALAKLPQSVSFEEGSILPMSVATAACGVFLSLEIARPPAKQKGGFLVWGASSSVGTAVVQIAKQLGYTVYGVNSARHSDYVKKLGAQETFDYNDANVVKTVIENVKASGQKIVIGFDTISENVSSPLCAEILAAFGGGKLCLTLPYPEDAAEKKPANVEIARTYAARIVGDQKEFGTWLFNEWLEKSLANKTYVPSPAIEIVEGGIPAVQKALDMHRKGLSGKKLVLPL
ncbi:hypothetical protein MMC21_003183 [Puttea exsequens]|nr:hypothetical protein [Puttea exsequens]